MAADPLTQVSTRSTPQSEQADPRQVPNAAGGYGFQVNDLDRLDRFLVTGTTGGTFYVREKELTQQNTDFVLEFARNRTRELVDKAVEISIAGRAQKQQPTLFALAVAASLGDEDGRAYAFSKLNDVARTGTMLKQFVTYAEQFRGWGPAMRRAVGRWYTGVPITSITEADVVNDSVDVDTIERERSERPVDDVAYQVSKYRTRHGWSDKDLLRLSHGSLSTRTPGRKRTSKRADGSVRRTDRVPELSADRRALFDWIAGREVDLSQYESLRVIEGFEKIKRESDEHKAARLVLDYRLAWEHVPDRFMNSPVVLDALLTAGMPLGALIRQLPRLTKAGLLDPLKGTWTKTVTERLVDPAQLRKARIHPVSVLIAAKTYEMGRGEQGRSVWTPSRPVVDALSDAFYASYGAVEPTGKNLLLALDVSGSMDQRVSGVPNLTCREAVAAFALATANIEPNYQIVAFSSSGPGHRAYGRRTSWLASGISPVSISPRQRLQDAVRAIDSIPMGGTDCALPMRYANDENLKVDAFSIYTDNESWAGDIHPHQALRQYREASGINSRFVAVAMTATNYTVSDPADPFSMDVAGMDASVPNLISTFVKGS